MLPDAAEGIVVAIQRQHREAAHPLVDVDDWIEGCFEFVAFKGEGLVERDDFRIVIAVAGTADLEAPAVSFLIAPVVGEVILAEIVVERVAELEVLWASGSAIRAVVQLEVEEGARFVAIWEEAVEVITTVTRHRDEADAFIARGGRYELGDVIVEGPVAATRAVEQVLCKQLIPV